MRRKRKSWYDVYCGEGSNRNWVLMWGYNADHAWERAVRRGKACGLEIHAVRWANYVRPGEHGYVTCADG